MYSNNDKHTNFAIIPLILYDDGIEVPDSWLAKLMNWNYMSYKHISKIIAWETTVQEKPFIFSLTLQSRYRKIMTKYRENDLTNILNIIKKKVRTDCSIVYIRDDWPWHKLILTQEEVLKRR
jgi:hypothetical protein